MEVDPHTMIGELRQPTLRVAGQTAGRPGFSMIELLVVIAIIVLLIGLSIGVSAAFRGRAVVTQTRGLLGRCQGIANEYQARTGNVVNLGTVSGNAYDIPWGTGGIPNPATTIGKFVWAVEQQPSLKAMLSDLNAQDGGTYAPTSSPGPSGWGEIRDSWGNLLEYYPFINGGAGPYPDHPAPFFMSWGPDGNPNTSDDLFSYDVR